MSSTDKIPNMEHSPDRQTSPTVLYSNELGMGEDMQYQQQFHFRVQHQSHQHSLQQHVMLHLQKQQDIQIQQGKERTMDGKLPHTPHTSSTPRQNTEKTTTVSKVNDKLDENKEKGSSGAVTMATTHTKLPTNQSSSPVLNNIPNIISQNSIFQHVNNVNPSSNTDQSLVRVAQRMTSSPIATGSPTTTLTPSIQSPTGAESQNQSIVNTSRDATTTPAPNSPITVNSSPIITSQIYTQSIAGSQPHTLPHTLPKSTPDDKNIKHTTTTTTILQDAVLSGVLSGMPPPRTTTAQFVATNYTTLAQQAQAASQGSLPPRSASGRLPPPTRRAGNSSSSHLGFRKITFPGVASGGGGITSTEISGKTSLIGGNLGNSGNSSNTQRFTLPSIGFMGGMLTTSYTNQQRGYGGGSGKIETGMPPTITPSQTQKHAQLPKPPPVSNPIAVNITGQNSNPPINVAVGHVGNSHSGKGGVGTGNEGQMTYMSSIISLVTGSSMSGRMSGTPSTHQTTTTASHSGVLADQMMKKTQQHLKRKREDGTAIDMNDLCLHSKKPCLQRKIDGYDYCMRHVMEDNHRFTLQSQASKKSKQSDQHLEQHRKNSRKRTNPSDTGRRPERRLGPAATPQERLERRIKLGIALQQHHIALGSEFIDPPLDGDESSSLSDEDSRQIETDVEGEGEIPYQWWVKGYNLGNNEEEEEDEDYLRAAGVFTEEELLERRRQKLLQLKDLYLNQYRRLGASLEDHQNMHLSNRNHFFKANNISLSHTGLPFEPAHEDARVIEHVEETDRDNEKVKDALELKEEALEARRRFVRRYRKRHGVEGHMHTLVLNRNKGSQSLCVFMDDGVRCTNNVMSLAKYCFNHILCDPKQVLFKPCAYQLQSGAQCSQPILAWHRVRHCDTHMGAEDFPRLARNTMQA
eukprot:Ihof_evm2s418 gene=Ihof_evmTU2s418